MRDKSPYVQFEFITNYVQNTKVVLTGEKLIGDIDFMYANSIKLFPSDEELKTIFIITTALVTTDTSANTVDAETELMILAYKYEFNFEVEDLYGLFCYATIFNYLTLTNDIRDKGIMHNDEFYRPTVVVPSFDKMRDEIVRVRNRAYGLE